jgi:hypothetical protein
MRTPRAAQRLFAVSFAAGLFVLPGTALSDGTPSVLSLVPAPRASDEARLRAALLSVHAFVEEERRDGVLMDKGIRVRALSVRDAAEIIARVPGQEGDLLRRRAMLRLLAWVRKEPGVQEAVAILARAPDAAKTISRRIEKAEHGSGCQPSDPEEVANDAVNDEVGKLSYGVCDEIDLMVTSVVPARENIGVTSVVIAMGEVDAARAGADAQRWDTCAPLWWGAAYIVKTKANGDVEEGGNDMPVEGTAVTPYGDPYDTAVLKRPFFEQFTCDNSLCDVRLLLHVVTKKAAVSTSTTVARPPFVYSLTYNEPRQWKTYPFPSEDRGSINVDAEDRPGGGITLKAEGNKLFAFKDWTTTFATYFMLRRIEMADKLAALVCCPKP